MNDSQRLVEVSRRFLKDLKRLEKKFKRVRKDIEPFIQELVDGKTPGDQIEDIGYPTYKARVRSSDLQRGKSGGYRVIYYISTPQRLILVTIYSKTEREDIPADELRELISAIIGELDQGEI
jgi:mRNA-degrading endonuclease RelE of RelBE toxin-antitoxin system